jgi:ABC-type branched-subunit amino acid transport system substrate-binding protein
LLLFSLFLLQTVAPDRFQSLVLSTLVRGNTTAILKPIPVVVVYENNTYGQGLADGFSAAYKKAGGRVRFNITVTPTNAKQTATDLAAQKVIRVVIATNNNTW